VEHDNLQSYCNIHQSGGHALLEKMSSNEAAYQFTTEIK